jgi:hypothetical protein
LQRQKCSAAAVKPEAERSSRGRAASYNVAFLLMLDHCLLDCRKLFLTDR